MDAAKGCVAPLAILEGEACRVHCFELGDMQNLVYLIEDRYTRRAAVVDPAWDVPILLDWAASLQCEVTDALLTHSHQDHTNGLWELRDAVPVRVHLHAADAAYWSDLPEALVRQTGEAVIQLGETAIRMVHTPGHSPGSVCYHLEDMLLTGDTLFVYGCGRCDLPGGNPEQMYATLHMLLARYPDTTRILPGHHYAAAITSTLAEQRRGNPFLHFDNPDAFVHFRREHSKHRLPPYEPVLPGEPAW